jgi:two-component system response regulator DesR
LAPCGIRGPYGPERGETADVTAPRRADTGRVTAVKRVFVAAERQTTRASLLALLEIEPGLEPVGEAATLPVAIRRLRALRPEILLVDRRLLGGAGLPRLPMLAGEAVGTAIVVVGMGDHPGLDAYAERAGAAGYLRLDEAAERVSSVVSPPPAA